MNNYEKELFVEKQIAKEKKEKLRKIQEDDLLNYHLRKLNEKRLEKENNLKLLKENENQIYNSYNEYRDKIYKLNNKIYDNVLRYNDYINGGKNDELYKVNNDLEFNKRLALLKEKEKKINLINNNQQILNKYNEENEKQKEIDRLIREEKINEQKRYRDILDKQNEEKKNELKKMKENDNKYKELVMMPGYKEPNLPKPLEKYFLNQNSNNSKTPNQDYFVKQRKIDYLGESNLIHNPITCPIDDLEHNKYVLNILKKMNNYYDDGNKYNNNNNMRLNKSFSFNSYGNYSRNYNLNNNNTFASNGNMVMNN